MGAIKFLIVLLLQVILIAPVQAQPPVIINVNINSSEYIDVGFRIIRLAAGNPEIAGVKQVGKSLSEILVEGYRAGSTSLLVWYEEYQPPVHYRIIVSPEDPGQAQLIEDSINLPNVYVKILNGRILLNGTVKNQYELNYAVQVASLYAGSVDNIINLLQMADPIQIRLEAMVMDIDVDAAKDLGIQWGESGSGGIFSMGESQVSDGISFMHNPMKWAEQRFGPINATINALVTNGKAKILSRPNITTMSGEQATIQIGGEIPYTTYDSSGVASTNFKDYGIILRFRPVVDLNEKITTTVHAEVSNLSGQTVDEQPIIATRRADSVVNLESGNTMVIGGLMDSSESKNVYGIPFLSKIPVIGEFFKYTRKAKSKHELIILITPQIVESNAPARMSENMKDFYTEEFYTNKQLEEVDVNNPKLPEPKTTPAKNTNKSSKNKTINSSSRHKTAKSSKNKDTDKSSENEDTSEPSNIEITSNVEVIIVPSTIENTDKSSENEDIDKSTEKGAD